MGRRVGLKTTYQPLSQRLIAHQKTERKAINILMEHFQERGFMKGRQQDEKEVKQIMESIL